MDTSRHGSDAPDARMATDADTQATTVADPDANQKADAEANPEAEASPESEAEAGPESVAEVSSVAQGNCYASGITDMTFEWYPEDVEQ